MTQVEIKARLWELLAAKDRIIQEYDRLIQELIKMEKAESIVKEAQNEVIQ